MGNIFRGFGSYIPNENKINSDFINNSFYDDSGNLLKDDGETIVRKFKKITGIEERKYISDELNNSDIGYFAAKKAIENAKINPEKIDQIIVAQNFGDVPHNSIQSDFMPSLAARIKQKLDIKNPNCIAYDVVFGCPGWVQGVIQAECFINSGVAENILIIGTETLSRVIDKHDRDSMIFSDGAGACILSKSDEEEGILSFSNVTFANEEADYLYFGESNKQSIDKTKYIKMQGRKIYEFALKHVPAAMKDALDKSGYGISDLKKIFIHQANEKMDDAIISRFYNLCGANEIPKNIMPMSIQQLGNSSVATVPTLIDLVLRNKMEGHSLQKGDLIMLASVGAGMHINAIVCKY